VLVVFRVKIVEPCVRRQFWLLFLDLGVSVGWDRPMHGYVQPWVLLVIRIVLFLVGVLSEIRHRL